MFRDNLRKSPSTPAVTSSAPAVSAVYALRSTLGVVIRSYRDDATCQLAERMPVRRFQAIETAARKALRWLEVAADLRDLSLPGLRLEKLKCDRAGQYSIRLNDQYRLCFRWKEDGAYDVELTDYH